MFGGDGSLLELVIAGTVLLAVRHLRGYEQLQAAEAAARRAEERERGRTRTAARRGSASTLALNNMLQGLLMFDQAAGCWWSTAACIECSACRWARCARHELSRADRSVSSRRAGHRG